MRRWLAVLMILLVASPAYSWPLYIACNYPGTLASGSQCGYYRTSTGAWDLLAMGEIGQYFLESTSQTPPWLVTYLPSYSQVIVFGTGSPIDTHGRSVVPEAEDTSEIRSDIEETHYVRNALTNRWDQTAQYIQGVQTVIFSGVIQGDFSFPNPNVPFINNNPTSSTGPWFLPPDHTSSDARGDSWVIETYIEGTSTYARTGPRAMAVMAFPPGYFEVDVSGNLVVEAILQVPDLSRSAPKPAGYYVEENTHRYGSLHLSGAPVTVIVADGIKKGKTICHETPQGMTAGPDGGNNPRGVQVKVASFYANVSGVTEYPISVRTCEPAYWSGVAVAFRRAVQ